MKAENTLTIISEDGKISQLIDIDEILSISRWTIDREKNITGVRMQFKHWLHAYPNGDIATVYFQFSNIDVETLYKAITTTRRIQLSDKIKLEIKY